MLDVDPDAPVVREVLHRLGRGCSGRCHLDTSVTSEATGRLPTPCSNRIFINSSAARSGSAPSIRCWLVRCLGAGAHTLLTIVGEPRRPIFGSSSAMPSAPLSQACG